MRLLITGAGGFIGSHLSDSFSSENSVWGVDNFLTGRRENGLCTELDILKRPALYMLANHAQPDVVIHCAASYSNPDLWHRDTETNVQGCINAAAIAKHHDAHLVYFQTILPPVSSYAISKIAGEQYLRLSGVKLTVLRLANIYGPRNLSGPIPVFYKRLTNGQSVTVVNTTRDMVYIEDLVRAVGLVVEHELTGTYDVCSGVQTPIVEMFSAVVNALHHPTGYEDVEPQEPLSDDVQGTVDPDNGVPMWAPVVSLQDGIAQTVAAYEQDSDFPTFTHLRMATDAA